MIEYLDIVAQFFAISNCFLSIVIKIAFFFADLVGFIAVLAIYARLTTDFKRYILLL